MSRLLAPLALLAGAVLAPHAPSAGRQERDARPNVVIVLADDLGHGDLGRSGNPDVRTPHLDALAESGVELARFYVSPVCGPSRAALLSGRYPRSVGLFRNGWPMQPGARTLAERLAGAGWTTGLFGKWHLGDYAPYRASDQGFGTTLVARGGVIGQLAETPNLVRYSDPSFLWNEELRRFEGEATDVTFDVALDWIGAEHAAGRPFLAVIATHAPHGPYIDVPEAEHAAYLDSLGAADAGSAEEAARIDALARVYALVSRLDANVGRLVARLRELGIEERTLVLFLSDNGSSGERFGAGLSGSKGTVGEGGVRVPCFARWPGTLPAGRRIERLAAHVDLVPTVLEACGVDAGPAEELDGRSVLPWLAGAEPEPDHGDERLVFLEAHRGLGRGPFENFCVVGERWKLLRASGFAPDDDEEGGSAEEESEGDPGEAAELDGLRLVDVVADPGEEVDRLAEHPEVAERYLAAYRAHVEEVGPPPSRSAPRIRLGPAERELLLTHDRRRWVVGAAPTEPWRLRVVRGGSYDLELVFPPADVRRRALVTAGTGVSRDVLVPPGAASARIPRVALRPGVVDLEARVDFVPVWQVRLVRR